jgi:hypothetical protein
MFQDRPRASSQSLLLKTRDMRSLSIKERCSSYLGGLGEKMDKMIRVQEEKVYMLYDYLERELTSFTTYIGDLWHKRMEHIHFGVLQNLREEVTVLPKITFDRHDPCKCCALHKYAWKPFPSSEHKSKGVLDLIH